MIIKSRKIEMLLIVLKTRNEVAIAENISGQLLNILEYDELKSRSRPGAIGYPRSSEGEFISGEARYRQYRSKELLGLLSDFRQRKNELLEESVRLNRALEQVREKKNSETAILQRMARAKMSFKAFL